MSSPTNSPQPISIHIPPSLRHLAVPLSQFLSENPQCSTLVVGACIFAPQHDPTALPHSSGRPAPRLLLVQRAVAERVFPNLWEVPGGSCEATDPTVMHSLAREVFEETGLHMTRVVRQVGKGLEFILSSPNVIDDKNGVSKARNIFLKLTFEIEVAELEPAGLNDYSTTSPHHKEQSHLDETTSESTTFSAASADHPTSASSNSSSSSSSSTSTTSSASSPFYFPPIVILDPVEHQRYAWVTEESFHEQDSLYKYPTTSEHQRETILQAFALRNRS